MNNKFYLKKNKGFTLVEMLVSIALFSIVLVIVLGTIVTIVDVNRKTRTLTEVINNLNFSLESVNRSLKTGTDIDIQNNAISVIDQDGIKVCFKHIDNNESINGRDTIGREVGASNCSSNDSDYIPITSSEVVIETFTANFIDDSGIDQPRINFLVKGYAETTRNIRSEFSVQTTVSQRNLDINDVVN